MVQLGLVGDDRGHASHRELNALIPRLRDELGVDARWVPTGSGFDVTDFDGVWLVPGSPYADDDAVYAALTQVRERRIPFLGTCGGMQYAVIEYLRTVLGRDATHAESDGVSDDNAVTPLACSLDGEPRLVSPISGSRFAEWVRAPFMGMHYCNFAPSSAAIDALTASRVVVGATAPDTPAEVLEMPDHPFFVVSLFQPHVGASTGGPIHPLIREFATAAGHTRLTDRA